MCRFLELREPGSEERDGDEVRGDDGVVERAQDHAAASVYARSYGVLRGPTRSYEVIDSISFHCVSVTGITDNRGM